MTATELPRPGVEVLQVFRTVTPTVTTPTLVPCVVGVCKQIVDVLVSASSGGSQLNPSALVSLPGFFVAKDATGSPVAYTGLDGLKLVLSITGGPDVEVTFSGNSLSPAAVVAQFLAAFTAAGVTEATAELTPSGLSFRVRTIGVGEFSTLEIKSGSDANVLTAFDLKVGYIFSGTTVYAQWREYIPLLSFPDPRGNLDELAIEASSVRVFLGLGSGANLREFSKTSSFLRRGGNGGTAASVTGSVALATGGLYGPGGTLDGKTLNIALDDTTAVAVSMGTGGSAPLNKTDLIQKINLALVGLFASESGGYLKITSKTKGTASKVLLSGNACAILGLSTTAASGVAAVSVVDDGNGDTTSPLVDVLGEDFTAAGAAATATGLVDMTTLTYPADLSGKTLTISVNGKRPQTLTFGTPGNAAAVLTAANGFWGSDLVATLDGGNHLHFATSLLGGDASIDVLGGTACGALGLVASLTGAVDLSTILPDLTTLNTKKVKLDLGGTFVEHTFSGLTNLSTAATVASGLNANGSFSALAVAEAVSNHLRVRLKDNGVGKTIRAVPASSNEAAYFLGFDTSDPASDFVHFEGTGHPPVSGDDLYVDGALLGRITAKAPGGVVTRLRVDKQLPINAALGKRFFIIAKNLTGAGVSGRPDPEVVIGSDGAPTIKANVLRDTTGAPVLGKAPIYLSYRAVREDVTAKAKSPGLLKFDSTTELTDALSPVSTANPLALGLYFALLNAPSAQISGLGVDEISADAPLGTVEAFERAAEALEAYEVYAIAPLTHDETVAQVFSTHVKAMSEPAAKGERICLFNFSQPSKRLDTLVASGLEGNSVGVAGTQLDTGVVNLAALLLNQGINPIGTIPVSAGLFLDIASDSKRYSISSISGGVVTIRTSFAAGENDDGFYSTTTLNTSPLPSMLINEPFAVRVRGAALSTVTGAPDKQGIAETYQSLAQSFLNRRFWSIVPDKATATLDGLDQIVDGFYLCAAISGMIGGQTPSQSFTNFPMTGFKSVIGSNGFFTETQLNIIAAGGNYIVVQDSVGAPLTARMALTTDMTSLETRTDSIQKVVDFTAKFMRRGLRAYIGRYNITQGFLDSLGHVAQGLLGFLTDLGVLIGANLNNIVQDESAPDTVLIDVTLDVPFPCNYIRLTLVI